MVSTKQNLLASFSCKLAIQLNGMKFALVMKPFKFNFLIVLLNEIYGIKGNKCFCVFLLTASKRFVLTNLAMHSEIYEPI